MVRVLRICFGFLILLLLIVSGGCVNQGERNKGSNLGDIEKVLVYNYGKVKEVRKERIREDLQKCLDSIVDSMELIVTNDRINNIKKNSIAVEVIFSEQEKYKFKIGNRNRIVKFNRLFIPLTGKYKSVIFLGDEDGYSPYPPYGSLNCEFESLKGEFAEKNYKIGNK